MRFEKALMGRLLDSVLRYSVKLQGSHIYSKNISHTFSILNEKL